MLLKTVGLTKSYKRRGESFFAAEKIEMQIEIGDFVCVAGSSGSGKSTLLHLLTGLLKADSGEILFEGEDICKLGDAARAKLRNSKIGYIPQGESLLQNFSVLDNIR
jgi:ABC-type lipoprotein export system ATPase subunit